MNSVHQGLKRAPSGYLNSAWWRYKGRHLKSFGGSFTHILWLRLLVNWGPQFFSMCFFLCCLVMWASLDFFISPEFQGSSSHVLTGEEDHRCEVPFLPHHVSGIYHQHDLSLKMSILSIWLISALWSYFFTCSIFSSLEAIVNCMTLNMQGVGN